MRFIYANNNLRTFDIDAQHFRKLAMLEHNSYEREAYENAVGASMPSPGDVLNQAAAPYDDVVTYPRQTLFVEVDVPWGKDKDFFHQLCSAALPGL